MKNDWDPACLDVRAFARAGGHLQGEQSLSHWRRLAQEAIDPQALVVWQMTGRTQAVTGGADQVWLDLVADVVMTLTCQRCLGPVACPMRVERSFRFVADETVAAQEDEEAEEDVLVWSARFDALALLEDELIMDLPMIPMHEACQGERVLTSEEKSVPEEKRPNPFAVLSALRTDKGG